MRGRKPKPTQQKRLEGNPGRRALNDREPELPPAGPDFDAVPAELAADAVAAEEWARSIPMLRERKVITSGDRGALVALCLQWSIYCEATDKRRALGMIVKAPSGYPIVNPYIGVANRALASLTKLWAELGLTPSSRSRVKTIETPGEGDPFAEFDHEPSRPVAH